MKTVYLLRHAKAERGRPAAADSERALDERGQGAAALVGHAMAARGWIPETALVSGAKRALQTFEILATHLGPDLTVRVEPGLYLVEADVLIARLRRLRADIGAVLLVGHNPGLQEAALALAGSADPDASGRIAETFPTAALVRLAFAVETWRDIGPGTVRSIELVTPKMLRKHEGGRDS